MSFGNATVPILGISPEEITFIAPSANTTKDLNATGSLSINGVSATYTLQYSTTATPVIHAVSVADHEPGSAESAGAESAGVVVASAAQAVQVIIQGSNFGSDAVVSGGTTPIRVLDLHRETEL